MYIIILKYLLPSIYKILKIRKEILDNLVSDSVRLVDEEYITRNIHKELFSTSVIQTADFLQYFQKRLVVFKNTCSVFVSKGIIFENSRLEYKNSLLVLKLKKYVLDYINK